MESTTTAVVYPIDVGLRMQDQDEWCDSQTALDRTSLSRNMHSSAKASQAISTWMLHWCSEDCLLEVQTRRCMDMRNCCASLAFGT